jgi:hypothetical protein
MRHEMEKTITELRPFNVTKIEANDDEPMTTVARHSRSTENMMKKIETFFSKAEHMGKLLPFLRGTSKISLRMVEWFVFVHSMKTTVDWFIGGNYFNVYLDYQAEMLENKKQKFDPMGRKWRKEKRKDGTVVRVYHGINFFHTEKDFIVTSVAQLNFFRWFIGKGILDYVVENFDHLSAEMTKFNNEKKEQKSTQKRLKIQSEQETKKAVKKLNTADSDFSDRKIRVHALKKVTKRHAEVFVSFD